MRQDHDLSVLPDDIVLREHQERQAVFIYLSSELMVAHERVAATEAELKRRGHL